MRNQSIDTSKGFLILLVIIGHIKQGRFEDSLIRYVIYGFHMPMFMAVSGYLFSANFNQISTSKWWMKVTQRAVLPWMLALFVFTAYLSFVGFYHLNLAQLVIEVFKKPFYHLWFIPAWIGYQAIIRWFEKINISTPNILMISAAITIIGAWLQNSGQTSINTQKIPVIAELFYTFKPQIFLFFVLGYFYKHHTQFIPSLLKTTLNNPMHLGLASSLFLGLFFIPKAGIHLPYFIKTTITYFTFLYLNLSLFSYGLPILEADKLPKSKLLNWMGKQSLLIYLWHPLAILFARYTISYRPTPEFYFSSITSTIIILIFIYFYDRYRNS